MRKKYFKKQPQPHFQEAHLKYMKISDYAFWYYASTYFSGNHPTIVAYFSIDVVVKYIASQYQC
jgi:hypothetical protein